MTLGRAEPDNPDAAESERPRPDTSSPRVRRRMFVAVILGIAVGAGAGGWALGSRIDSPQQAAARAEAPPPSLITVPVQQKVLTDDYVTRGTVFSTQSVGVGPSITPPGPGARSVITRVPVGVGAEVAAGQVVLEVSGRPVVALRGAVPAYRDLVPGAVGGDVTQLQRALAGLGLSTRPDPRGSFGNATSAALAALYRRAGYELPAEGGLPADEVVWLSSFPARVASVAAAVGSAPTPTSVVLSGGQLDVLATVPVADQALLRPAQPVEVFSETLSKSVKGSLLSISGKAPAGAVQAGVAASDQSDTSVVYVVIRTATALGVDFQGQDVRVTVTGASSEKPVLVVPVTAISQRSDGTTTVSVVDGTSTRSVPVRAGLVANGEVEVSDDSDSLKKGDLVVIGSQQADADAGTG